MIQQGGSKVPNLHKECNQSEFPQTAIGFPIRQDWTQKV
jgi:hypothetical protein